MSFRRRRTAFLRRGLGSGAGFAGATGLGAGTAFKAGGSSAVRGPRSAVPGRQVTNSATATANAASFATFPQRTLFKVPTPE